MRWLPVRTSPDHPRRRNLLAREIALLLVLKILLLYVLWLAFFSHPQVSKMTEGMPPDRVAAALVAIPQPPTPERDKP
jgi:hypothetical protein